jgi:hypothetical protein
MAAGKKKRKKKRKKSRSPLHRRRPTDNGTAGGVRLAASLMQIAN